jgi:DNA-binding SARP family transcriptional activator/tetratricopeptide (TPR) repeat protein
MSGCKLFLFGPPRLEQAGTPLSLGRRRAEALLAYLSVTRQRHSREALATLFWPEYSSARGRANLSRTLSVLNKALGAGCLVADRETVGLRPEAGPSARPLDLPGGTSGQGLWVDVTRFQQLLATCATHGHPESMVCAACLSPLAKATALYTADFLAGFTLPGSAEWDSWQFYQTEGLRRELCGALERLGRGHRGQGNWETAIVYVRRWVGLEPLHEPAHRQLMMLYAHCGQQAAALAQYETCRRVLEADLGVTPAEETRSLYEQVRIGALGVSTSVPDRSPGIPPQPPAFLQAEGEEAVSLRPVFVARERELAQLDAHLAAALDGQGRVVFVTGATGCGKTALMSEFACRAQEIHADLIVASGTCHAYSGVGEPYLPFRDVMGMLTGDVEARWAAGLISREHACRLWQMLPEAIQALVDRGADLIDIFVPGKDLESRATMVALSGADWLEELRELTARKRASSADLSQSYLIGQYANVLHSLAAGRPLLITLDDLQWADFASAGVLFHLGRSLAGSRVLLLGAYRPEEVALGRDGERHPLEKVLAEFKRTFGDIWIDLDESEEAEGREFVDAILDTEPNRLSEGFRQALFQRTRGHPLFTVELLRGMQERGNLVRDEDRRWVEGTELDWRTLPARVEGVIEERIGRLEPVLHEILSVASVEGERFTADVIARVQGVGERQILRALSQLEKRHRLVREREEVRVDHLRLSRYQFAHILFQGYLYRDLSSGERRLLHDEIAQALERLYEGHIDEITVQLAHHFLKAAESEKAAGYLDRSGDQARRLAALEEAARYYRAALKHWPPAEQTGRAELLRKLGECLWMYGDPQEALETLEAGYDLFTALGDRVGAGVTQRIMAEICLEEAAPERWQRHHQRALSLLEDGPETVELARVISALSRMYTIASEHDQALAWGERALAMAERLGAEDVTVHALNSLGTAYTALGDPERGLGLLRDSLRRALALNLPFDVARAYFNLVDQLQGLGRYAESRATLEAYRAYGLRVQSLVTINYALIFLGLVEWLCGHWAAALALRPMIVEWIDSTQSTGYHQIFGRTVLGLMDNDLGRPETARRTLESSSSLARDSGALQRAVPYLGELARAYASLGLDAETMECVQEILGWFDRTPHVEHIEPMCTIYLLFACQWLAAHSPSEGLDDAHVCVRQLALSDAQMNNPVKVAILREGQGSLALAKGNFQQAVEGFRQAVTGWTAVGRTYDQLRALKGLGQALVQRGDSSGARTAFDQALGIVATLAMQLEGTDLRTSFLNSALVQGVRDARAAL